MSRENGSTGLLPTRRVRRALLPLLLWGIAFLLILAWQVHRHLLTKTQLKFITHVRGESVAAEARVDGKPFRLGGNIGIGFHKLLIQAKDAEPLTTKFFVWYGGKDLGELELQRSHGRIHLSVEPAAYSLYLKGPYASYHLTNAYGLTSNIPVGVYEVETGHDHFRQTAEITVKRNGVASHQLHREVGTLAITSEATDAKFRLVSTSSLTSPKAGPLPMTYSDLPTGTYQLRVQRGDYVQNFTLELTNKAVIEHKVRFAYGTLALTSEPAAQVSAGGTILGQTPLTHKELIPGEHTFRLELEGYEPQTVRVTVAGDETVTRSVKLVHQQYAQGLRQARQYAEREDFVQALENLAEALAIDPKDPTVLQLQKDYRLANHKQKATEFRRQQDFAKADNELAQALALEPKDADLLALQAKLKADAEQVEKRQKEQTINALLAEAKEQFERKNFYLASVAVEKVLAVDANHTEAKAWQAKIEPAQKQAEAEARLKNPEILFEREAAKYEHNNLFEAQFLRVRLPVSQVRELIFKALGEPVTWKVLENAQPDSQSVLVIAEQKSILFGRRQCLLVASQVTDTEVHLYYKIWDYTFADTIVLDSGDTKNNYIPVHPGWSSLPSVPVRRRLTVEDFQKRLIKTFNQHGKSD